MSINKYASLPDRELVDLLLQGNQKAWDYVLLNLVAPLSRQSKYMQICKKYSISPDSLVTAVWLILYKNDYQRLRLFRFESSFKTYLFIIVREAQRNEVKQTLGHIPPEMSEVEDLIPLIADRRHCDTPEVKDEIDFANELFAQLWRESPKQAWVLLMRTCLDLPAKTVALFMEESASNVDKMNSRAKEKMNQLRKGE